MDVEAFDRRSGARRWCAAIALLSIPMHTACEPSIEASSSLVDHERWAITPEGMDPLDEHRPARVACAEPFVREGDAIEIDTGRCNYVSLSQPLSRGFGPGEPLGLRLWWATLASQAPAQGHLALLVDGELLWDEWIPIPGPADVVDLEFDSPVEAAAGSTLTFHLHNHGYNTWTFERLDALAED